MEKEITLARETVELNNIKPQSLGDLIRNKVASIFMGSAEDSSDTDFINYLLRKFGKESAQQVRDVFEKMNLPLPKEANQYLKSNEGCILFVNKYGVVVRIEPQTPEKDYYVRVNDSGCILQPLASIDAGKAVVEICPGGDVEKDEASIDYIKELLKDEGLHFSDDQLENLGRLHTDNEKYPKGILVILDRLAVSNMKGDVKIVTNKLGEEAKKEQERFTSPFRKAFKEGLADNSKMHKFWDLCESYVADGKIITGWNDNSDFFDKIEYLSKTSRAEEVAKYYAHTLKKFEKRNAKK